MNITSPRFFVLSIVLASFCFSSLPFGVTQQLPEDEVEALKGIAKTLGKDWDSSIDNPCSGPQSFSSCIEVRNETGAVICNCSYADGTVCHITHLCLKRQNLAGTLPPELVKLRYLQDIDLYFNYLNGSIPREWGSMNLTTISLGGNRLTGSIPPEIGNISTLREFVVEFNQLTGKLPPELGKLTQLHRLQINSNNFTGELPATLANLKSLQTFLLGDNQFSGKIPDFIQSWTNLNTLIIQGSGLSGPIPSGISLLGNLTDLRISDLNGSENSPFPRLTLSNMTMTILVLKSCNINGTLPPDLGAMKDLKTLDLSFNNLTGEIPSAYADLSSVNNLYLTGNFLMGSVPNWTKTEGSNYRDLSYNNFSIESQGSQTCQEVNVNLFASSLTQDNYAGRVSCLGDSGCTKTSSLYINCGGQSITVDENKYDGDTEREGRATYYKSASGNWAFSSTGNYIGNNSQVYIISSNSKLSVPNAGLYMNARISPLSLTYYGFCLENGNYMVHLHFAEIMFTDDQTYNSLGRRVFDIYIQGNLRKKDFNIAEEAGGNYKETIKPFPATVTNNTLEIRFYWAGKGTTSVPTTMYGPLISAISVKREKGSSLSAGAVVGIVAAIVVIIILVLGILRWKGYLGKKNSSAKELEGLELQTSVFTLRTIKAATNDFDITNKIGEGGFGPVYKGCLPNGTIIAVKQLSSKSRQGNREFLNEIGMISALQHPCLVKLYGCCVDGDQLLLVYEYLENNSLARALFGPEEHQIKLDWPTRHRICIGIARGLAYLHEESRLKVVHRDIKATNVLLDKDLNPKISDFGLAKLDEEDNTHISTRIAGTYGYMAPEYAMHGYLTDKADVYSFGIVALEIVSGRTNTTQRQREEAFYLLDWARLLKEKGNLMELVDRRLGSSFNKEEVVVMVNMALLCTNVSPTLRPTMSAAVSMLEGKIVVPEQVSESSELLDEKRLEALRLYYNQQDESISMEAPLTSSSTSAKDLYSIHLDSSYLEKRN